MQRLSPAYLIVLAFAAILAVGGCASAALDPETPRERLVAAEADYQAMVRTIGDLADRGLIKGAAAARTAEAIGAARAALDAWHLAPDSHDRRDRAIAVLQSLQVLIRSLTPATAVWLTTAAGVR